MVASVAHSRVGVSVLAVLMALAGLWLTGSVVAHAAILEVTTTTDQELVGTNDCSGAALHTCTLRAAIQTAAAASSATVIHLPGGTAAVPKVYKITRFDCTNDDTCLDFNVHGSHDVTINGDGSATTIIDGNKLDRVIQVSGTNLNLSNVTVRNGDATKNQVSGDTQEGGAIDVVNGGLSLASSVISGNTATNGGGIDVRGANAQQAQARPAFSLFTSTAILTDVTIHGNTSADSQIGAGLYSQGGTGVTLIRVTVDGNTITGDGEGAGVDADGVVGMQNVTITNNNAGAGGSTGGGIAVDGTATMLNVTVNHNSASAGANIDIFDSATGNFKNSIFADPQGGGANCTNDGGGTFNSQGSNLENPGTTCSFTGTGDIQNKAPVLGPLQDNTGKTKTEALGAGSPAINAVTAANCPPPGTDQRGVTRPQNGKCDIGAFEVLAAIASPAPTASIAAATPSLPKAGEGIPGAGSGTSWVILAIVAALVAPLAIPWRLRAL